MIPNWQTTASNDASANGSACASAVCHSIPGAGTAARAYETIASFRSVATSVADWGSAARRRRVTTPVPHASSSTRIPSLMRRRPTRSAA